MCFVDSRSLLNVSIYMDISNERSKLILSMPYICNEKCGVGKRSKGSKCIYENKM